LSGQSKEHDMKKQQQRWVLATLLILSTVTPLTQAQTTRSEETPVATSPRGYGPGQGPYGPGMMGSYGPSRGGYGPGMMGGDGSGYGPGMMGGYGYGRSLGGGGMSSMMDMMGITGHGRMGLGPYYALDLSEQQRTRMFQIQDEMRKKNWDVVGRMVDEQARLSDLYATDKRDPATIGKQTMKIAELRRQLVEASVEAHNRIEALLTKEQKERLRSFGRGWMMGDD
jgi:Spy/CpxP family protein refolding chaperone